MSTTNKSVTTRQLERLLDFLQDHRCLALGRVRGKEGSLLSKKLWQQCSILLNEDLQGAHKSAQEWKKYYNQYKSRTKSKIRQIKEGLKGTGGGPANTVELTPLEERLYSILGSCSSPLPVRINPLDEVTNQLDIATGNDEILQAMEIVIDDSEQYIEEHHVFDEETEAINDTLTLTQAAPSHSSTQSANTGTLTLPQAAPSHSSTQSANTGVNIERPQRRRRRRESLPKENDKFEEAAQRLAAMEQARIDVDRELVVATNRQASVLEKFVDQIERIANLYEGSLRNRSSFRRTRVEDSRLHDSDESI